MTTPSECFSYLDSLRESGVTNMWGAAPYLTDEFNIEPSVARRVLCAWMGTFNDQQSPEERALRSGLKL